MKKPDKTRQQLLDELEKITPRMTEAEETLRAILSGEVDGLVVKTAQGDRVFTLSGADHPYRIMVETMNEGAISLAADGTILFCNQRFADIVKGSLEKVVGSSIFQYFSLTDLQLFKVLFGRGLKGTSKMELSLRAGGKNSVPVLLSISALGHTDMPGAACMVVTDLSEQKRNEEMLAEEKLTTQILNEAAEIFILCDSQGRIIRASQSTNKLFGKSPILQAFDKAFHLQYADRTPFVLLSEMSDNGLHAVEVFFNHGKNNVFSFLLSANAVISDKGVIGIVVVMVDITERKKVEEKIEHLASFPQLNPHPVIETDLKGQVIFCNVATIRVLRELNAPEDVRLFLPRDLNKMIKKLEQGNDQRYLSHEVEINGRAFTESLILSAKMKVVRIYAQDITERKKMEEELQKAYDGLERRVVERTAQLVKSNKALEQQIAKRITIEEDLKESQERLRNLTKHLQKIREQERAYLSRELHDELGQALTGMKMDISWIERRLPEDSTLILERLHSTVMLIESAILSVQRISRDLRPPALDDFGLSEAIRSVLTDFEKKTNITYKFISTPQRIVLNGELSIEIFRIFQEAFTNSTRHADAKNVIILLRNTGDKLTMEVSDDGRGITKKEILDHKSIGLMGMRERVYALEGTLEINGVKGKGTTITVSIPLHEDKKKNNTAIKRSPKKTPEEA
jgi:PAS domain S-box-containing protein